MNGPYNSPQHIEQDRTDRMYEREEAKWYSKNDLLTGAEPDALTKLKNVKLINQEEL